MDEIRQNDGSPTAGSLTVTGILGVAGSGSAGTIRITSATTGVPAWKFLANKGASLLLFALYMTTNHSSSLIFQ